MLRKYKSLYSSTCNTFSTGESVTITPASVTGLPTDTEITLTFDRVDSSGTKTPSKMERIRGNIVGSNFVVSSGGRAVEGTEQVHTSPVVEMIWNADDWNDTVDHILTEHNQDGTHKDTLVTSLKATGAVVNTGTSDVTIVTPKAIADAGLVKDTDGTLAANSDSKIPSQKAVKTYVDSGTVTMTNKTLTSPVFNGNVDGWISDTDTWVYVSATTFKIAGKNVTSKFPKGTKLKLTQTSTKYFYVIGSTFSTDTTITVTGGADYSLANADITSPYYSYVATPQGHPIWFAYTATLGSDSGTITTETHSTKFKIDGTQVTYLFRIAITDKGTGSGGITLTTPVTQESYQFAGWGAENTNGTQNFTLAVAFDGSGKLRIKKYDGTTVIANDYKPVGGIIYCYS